MDNTNTQSTDNDLKKEMPTNAVFPKCATRKNDRVIMHTDIYEEYSPKDEYEIM